jgi:hypothetical protein
VLEPWHGSVHDRMKCQKKVDQPDNFRSVVVKKNRTVLIALDEHTLGKLSLSDFYFNQWLRTHVRWEQIEASGKQQHHTTIALSAVAVFAAGS